MNFNFVKSLLKQNASKFSELGDNYLFYPSEKVTNIAYISITEIMLSRQFLSFLLENDLNFNIFPAFDAYNFYFDVQIQFD